MSDIWPGPEYEDWKGEIKSGCSEPYFLLLVRIVVYCLISFVVGFGTAFLILRKCI